MALQMMSGTTRIVDEQDTQQREFLLSRVRDG